MTASEPRIDALDASVYTVPTDAPEGDGTYAWDKTTMVLVEVRSGDVTGLGYTYGPPACASVARETLADVVVGLSAFDVPRAAWLMAAAVRNMSRSGIAGYAVSAVDIALWDLKAKLLGLPLQSLLGAAHESVDVYGSGGFTTYNPGQLRDQLGGWAHEQGIPRVKIKIGESWGQRVSRDLERMRQAREVIGSDTELFVDANGGYTAKQAVRVMREAADLEIRWFEEPVSSDDLVGLGQVRAAVAADVAAGEYASSPGYVRRMCEAGAVDCMQADATRCGGITGWLAAAGVAASFHLQISGHCAPHVHVQAALAAANTRHLEWFHDHVRIERMFFDGTLDPQGGSVEPDASAPGLGLTLRREDADRYRVG
ncbi:mandelate racemase [Microbacterium sp. STN6]|uniref:enolase C-terminal domain-like protein n=1 Tax=Microbacterium sp. STN6 TaxID=2995588 RepID=UPI002260A67C|nr:enolase C-terminal domain-like protein [Microbacterium sp. STN6]MCX7523119.1 mandelate racemase [Microbacterium sp. STN6]